MREPVDITQPTPVYGNPGYLLHGPAEAKGRAHRCVPCGVRWHGEATCWACGSAV